MTGIAPVQTLQLLEIGGKEYVEITLFNEVCRAGDHGSLIPRLHNRGHIPGNRIWQGAKIREEEMVMWEIFVQDVQH